MGPGDELEAVGRGRMRASHTDRERVIGTLKVAFVQGRLAKDEFDVRVNQTFTARTYAELAADQRPKPARAPSDASPTLRPGPVLTVATMLYAGAWAYEVFLTAHGADNPTTPPVIFGGGLVYLMVLLICVGHMLVLRREKRTGGQLPRRGSGLSRRDRQPRLPADRNHGLSRCASRPPGL